MLALAVVAFVACDDDDEGLNGWTDTAYVYVQGETLGNDMLKQAVVIETEGLEDATPCVYTFRACINKPAKADATVSLTAAASGGIADMLENTMTLSAESLTIPAGQLASEEATLTIDPAFLAITDEQKTYDPAVFTVTVGELKTSCNDVRLSTKTNKVTVPIGAVRWAKASMVRSIRFSMAVRGPILQPTVRRGNLRSIWGRRSRCWGRIQDTGDLVMLRGRSKSLLRRTTRRGNRMVRSRYPALRRTGGS